MQRTITHHVKNLQEKPHHVREAIAVGVSAGVTGLVAIMWVAAMASSDAFLLTSAPEVVASADNVSPISALEEGKSDFSELLGAAGAAFTGASTTSALTIVDSGTASSISNEPQTANNTSQTVLHF